MRIVSDEKKREVIPGVLRKPRYVVRWTGQHFEGDSTGTSNLIDKYPLASFRLTLQSTSSLMTLVLGSTIAPLKTRVTQQQSGCRVRPDLVL